MFEPKTLKNLAESEKDLKEWLDKNRKEFCEALGLWCDDQTLILMLAKLPDFAGGWWPGYKDDIDRAGCDILTPFLGGEQVDPAQLRTAVALLVQRFNAACEKIYYLDRRPKPQPRPRRPFPRGPRAGS